MVLEHQCQVHNQLVAAGINYRRIYWLQKSLDPTADPDSGTAGKHADDSARKIANLLLFENEADLGEDGIEGGSQIPRSLHHALPKIQRRSVPRRFSTQEPPFQTPLLLHGLFENARIPAATRQIRNYRSPPHHSGIRTRTRKPPKHQNQRTPENFIHPGTNTAYLENSHALSSPVRISLHPERNSTLVFAPTCPTSQHAPEN